MAFGQPFYNYGTNPYGGQNNGYAQPQPQYGNFYGQQQNMPQNANSSASEQFQMQQQRQQQVPQISQVPPRTNIAPVASLVDAMSRTSEPNTNMYYADQDQPFIYQISIDMQGRKTYKTFKIEDVTEQTSQQSKESVAPSVDLSDYAKKEDLQALKEEIIAYAKTLGAVPSPSVAKAKKTEKVDEVKE